MAERSRFIAQERLGAWVVVTLGVAVLALVTAIWGVMESRTGAVVVQTQVIKLNERIKALEAAASSAHAEAAAVESPSAASAEGSSN